MNDLAEILLGLQTWIQRWRATLVLVTGVAAASDANRRVTPSDGQTVPDCPDLATTVGSLLNMEDQLETEKDPSVETTLQPSPTTHPHTPHDPPTYPPILLTLDHPQNFKLIFLEMVI